MIFQCIKDIALYHIDAVAFTGNGVNIVTIQLIARMAALIV